MRYEALQRQLVDAVLASPGETTPAVRRAVFGRGKAPGHATAALDEPLASYVEKVARHAYKVTDADVAALTKAGYSDDAIFELTVAAAVGAAMHRLGRGLAALHGKDPT
ncbi:MAG: hypothetical protein ACREMN_03410 [Gemmatimonadales bacterium]